MSHVRDTGRPASCRPRTTAALIAAGLTVGLLAGSPAHATGQDAERAYRAGQAASNDNDRRAHYQAGIEAARQALATDPNDPAALLWYAGNMGAEALTRSKFSALKVIGEIERTLLKLEGLSPNYQHAAAARALGRLYHQAPAVISVGSNDKAAVYLGKALARAPEFPGNQAFAADLYRDQGDCDRARPLALKLTNHPRLDQYGPDIDVKEWREIAQKTLRKCGTGAGR